MSTATSPGPATAPSSAAAPIPVTVLTGFLGSGKTTLLNRILTEQHGRKLAVIENEFGEVGIDHQLVIQSDEELFEMNNGCICCKVRGDLIRVLGRLMKRKDRLDGVLIETTGLADPGPVAQTFFTDDEMKAAFRLDAIVTVVDAKHISTHLDQGDESKAQVGFADVILLNKTDLVAPAALDALESRLRGINAAAKIHRTQDCAIALEHVLGIGGFNLSRATDLDPKFLEPEYPFEWAGAYELAPGTYDLCIGHHPDYEHGHAHEHGECGCDHDEHEHGHEGNEHAGDDSHTHAHAHDTDEENGPAHGEPGHVCGSGCGHAHDDLDVVLMPVRSTSEKDLRAATDAAVLVFSDWEKTVLPGEPIVPGGTVHRLKLKDGHAHFPVTIERAGHYLLITGHDVPTHLYAPGGGDDVVRYGWDRTFRHEHRHNDDVTSVGIHMEGTLDGRRLNEWIGELLRTKGGDIYRMKGVLNVKGADRRLVFQGVHMLFDAKLDRPWAPGEPRASTLVFIGKNLDRTALTEAFKSCLV